MDTQDKQLLNEIQSNFPVASHPYRVIGKKLGMNEEEVLSRIKALRAEGIIRRLGASIDSRRIGFVSTLLAAQVPREKFQSFVRTVNTCPGVTHNYERNHEYNVWFTLIAPSAAEKERIIDDLKRRTGVDILELPAKKIFKIRVDFRFS
jgi:DNA-binding Lrp family transcriptional regulator